MEKFLEKHNLPKLKQNEIEYMNVLHLSKKLNYYQKLSHRTPD